MKETKNILRQKNDVMNTADAVNHENSRAWTKSDTELLDQLAMTGTLGASFYASAKETTEEALALLDRCPAQEIATAIVKGRNEGFIRTFPILGLVTLSRKSPEKFKEIFASVIRTGNDLIDFIELCKASRGLGRSVKTAISAWISSKTNDYYAQKYRTPIADAIRLVRFKGDSDPIFGYILAGYGDKLKAWSVEKLEAAYAKYPVLRAHRDFVESINAGDTKKACAILKENNLDVDSLTACYDKFDKAIWHEIARLSPVMRFMKYLDKFDRSGVFDKSGIAIAENKMTVANFQKAKVFPFRLYTAYMNISNQAIQDILAKVLDEYTAAYDWGAFNEYSWAICPDVSGSMQANINGSKLRFKDIAGMFTGFFRKGLADCIVVPWSDEVKKWNVPKQDSVMTHIRELNRMNGGTDMSCALRELTAKHVKKDFFVFITDTEEYGESYFRGKSWISAWKDYRKTVNSRAEAFILRADTYDTNPFPDNYAVKFGIHPIYGWNDNVVKFMEYVVKNRKKVN